MGAYLPISALPGLRKYKYACEDRSLISKYILKPFYVRIVNLLPMWLAPNTVTLLGLLFSICSFARAHYFNSKYGALHVPRWVYFAHAFDLFLYQTLDALDGQQARRTGSSSPLGELFDHCVDAMNTSLQSYVAATVLVYPSYLILSAQFMCLMNFFLSTWEEYHTKKLFLSVFSGPVEGILMIVAAEILTGILGPQIWLSRFGSIGGFGLTAQGLLTAVCSLGLIMNSISALSNVQNAVRGGFSNALLGLVPFMTMWLGFAGWIWVAWDTLSSNGFMPYFLVVGCTCALVLGRVITAHVTAQKFPMWTPSMAAPLLGIILHFISPVSDLQSLWLILGLSVGIYASFIAEIITEITAYLGIKCFSIKDVKKTR